MVHCFALLSEKCSSDRLICMQYLRLNDCTTGWACSETVAVAKLRRYADPFGPHVHLLLMLRKAAVKDVKFHLYFKCCIFVANAVHCSSCSHTFHLGEIITITPKILSSSSTINHQHETIIGFSFYHDCKPRCCCCRNSKFIDCSQLFSSYHMHIYILSSCTSHSQILCSALIFGLLMTLIKIKLM